MDKSCCTYLGYAKFEPVQNSDLSWLVFPLNTQELTNYTIGTSVECDMQLPILADDATVFQSVITVNVQGKVSIKNCTDETLKVAGSILQKEESSDLTDKTIVVFGPHVYVFQLTDAPTARCLKVIRDNVECVSCRIAGAKTRFASCGHVFCMTCVTSDIPFESLGSVEIIVRECPNCHESSPFSRAELSRNVKAVDELNIAFKYFDSQRPICGVCCNRRLFVHGSDYYFCEECRLIACPMCTFDWHRDHALSNYHTLARKAGQEFAENCENVKKRWTSISNKLKTAKKFTDKAVNAEAKCLESLNAHQLLIENQTKPLIRMFLEIEHLNGLQWNHNALLKRNDLLVRFERTFRARYEELLGSIEELIRKAELLQKIKRIVGTPSSNGSSLPLQFGSTEISNSSTSMPSLHLASNPPTSNSSSSSGSNTD